MTSPAKTRILDAAEDLFANKGFEATSVVDIAAVIGISGPAIYKHYGSKTDIYDAVIERLFGPLKGFMALTDPQAEETYLKLLEQLVKYHIDHPNVPRIIQQATLSSGEHLSKLVTEWYQPFFSQILQRNSAPAPIIMAFHSMLLGYITLAPLHRQIFQLDPLDTEHIAQQLRLQTDMAKVLSQLDQAP